MEKKEPYNTQPNQVGFNPPINGLETIRTFTEPKVTIAEKTYMSSLAQICTALSEYSLRLADRTPIRAMRWYFKGYGVAFDLLGMMLREAVEPTVVTEPPISLKTFASVVKQTMDTHQAMAEALGAEATQAAKNGNMLDADAAFAQDEEV